MIKFHMRDQYYIIVLFYVSYILSEILRVYRQYSLVYQFDSST